MKHLCHWPGCKAEVPPRLWGCKKHWYQLPKVIRENIMLHYRPGQEIDKKPSKEYLEVVRNVRQWIGKDEKV